MFQSIYQANNTYDWTDSRLSTLLLGFRFCYDQQWNQNANEDKEVVPVDMETFTVCKDGQREVDPL